MTAADSPAELPTPAPADREAALALLREGELEIEGRMLDASNATLFCLISTSEAIAQCVYKPVRGERPLWDFPDGTLAGRELAAYEVSEASGWELVPPTVLRDGPFGVGMVQLWVDLDETVDVERLVRSDCAPLRRIALFDAVINNADRKGGHLLPVDGGRHVYGIDHGIAFHREDKLRTLLWGWRGRKFSRSERDMLERVRFDVDLEERLYEHVTVSEVGAMHKRIERLLRTGVFPSPSGDWPAIPWPPF